METGRAKLSYANVMATLGVFIALGGTGYAISELEKNEVTSKHVKNNGIKNKDLADNSITSPKVLNGSLLGEDFAPGQLPQGPKGPQGPEGPQGEEGLQGEQGLSGATNVTVRTGADVTVDANDTNAATADCQAGERATGGGWEVVGGNLAIIDYANRPMQVPGETPVSWLVELYNPSGSNSSTARPYVICASP